MTSKKLRNTMLAVTVAAVICLCAFLSACTTTTKSKGLTLKNNLSETTVEAVVGQKIGLEADVSVRAMLSYSGEVEWTSSDEDVATVQSGIVTAKSVGEATITAKAGKYYDWCVINVTEGVLKVGIKDDVKGFGYYDPYENDYTGMEVDLAYMIAYELGYSDVEFTPLKSEERIPALESDEVDCVIATFSMTVERMGLVDFVTTPYYTDYIMALTTSDYKKETGAESVAEISDYVKREIDITKTVKPCVVGTVEGTTALDEFDNYLKEADIDATYDDGTRVYELFDYEEFETYEEASAALYAGEVNLFLGDYSIVRNYQTKSTSFTDDRFGEQNYCIATKKSDGAGDSGMDDAREGAVAVNSLHDDIEELILRWEDDGTMAALLEKWGLAETE